MKNIIRIYNLTVRFSKFILNIEIYEEFVEFLSELVWRETLFFFYSIKLKITLLVSSCLS